MGSISKKSIDVVEAGKKGGKIVSQIPGHMSKIGKKGGKKISADRKYMAEIGRRGGLMVSKDKRHMAEIGRKGGRNRTRPEPYAEVENAHDPVEDIDQD